MMCIKRPVAASEIDEEQSSPEEEIHYWIVKLHPDIQAQLDEIHTMLKFHFGKCLGQEEK